MIVDEINVSLLIQVYCLDINGFGEMVLIYPD